ncbi:MAG TPA: tetratricopeptide repeat protein [Gemmatimonadaceae bacterium]|nr:tetratricopeptide repeat protein [Gemmatimonadaceae bacterium]
MVDEIRRLSEELARDPSSPVYLRLGEALRRRADLEVALKVAERGVQRHAHSPDAHDLLARICVDRGVLERARAAWETVLRLMPGHLGALKGLGYVLFKQGHTADAERMLAEAASRDPADESIATALAMVRGGGNGAAQAMSDARVALTSGGSTSATTSARGAESTAAASAPPGDTPPRTARASSGTPARAIPAVSNGAAVATNGAHRDGTHAPAQGDVAATLRDDDMDEGAAAEMSAQPLAAAEPAPGDARTLFGDIVAGGAHAVVLLDADGLVAAGHYPTMDGRDASQEVGVELSGVRDEAQRAVQLLGLGAWHFVLCETEEAAVALAPAAGGALLVTLSSRDTPLGFVRRLLERCRARANDWLGADE